MLFRSSQGFKNTIWASEYGSFLHACIIDLLKVFRNTKDCTRTPPWLQNLFKLLHNHNLQHTRHMAPFGVLLAQKLHTSLVLQLAKVLMEIYQCMDECWDSYMASKFSMMMGCIYVELRCRHGGDQHLEDQAQAAHGPGDVGVPAQGIGEPKRVLGRGSIAKLAMRKGGANTHFSCSMNAMNRYRALVALGAV